MGDGSARSGTAEAARVSNADGVSPYLVVCDHASNFVPARFHRLGLSAADLQRHIAWDPGALAVAERLSDLLDAPLVECRYSRLLIDCNRPLDAADLIPTVSETTLIPGNREMSEAAMAERIALIYEPFHSALERVVDARTANGAEVRLIAVHSFTPVYRGASRAWNIGIIHDEDERLSAPLLARLRRQPGIVVGDNEPYSPADRVYHTLERHGRSRGHACAMIEIRNDEIASGEGQRRWSEMLASILSDLEPEQASAATPRRDKPSQPVG